MDSGGLRALRLSTAISLSFLAYIDASLRPPASLSVLRE